VRQSWHSKQAVTTHVEITSWLIMPSSEPAAAHWNSICRPEVSTDVSWFQEEPTFSLELIALAGLDDADLNKTVSIRNVTLDVHEALHRSLAHASYHVGQIVYMAKSLRGDTWQYLSIPLGES
jgi:hypothetical protein